MIVWYLVTCILKQLTKNMCKLSHWLFRIIQICILEWNYFMVILISFFSEDTKWLGYIMNNLCRLQSIIKRTRWQNDSHVFVPFWFSPVVSWSCFLCQVPPPGRHLWVAVQTVTREFIDQLQGALYYKQNPQLLALARMLWSSSCSIFFH